MAMFAAAPGMPWPVFLLIGGAMMGVGLFRWRHDAHTRARAQASAQAPSLDEVPDDADVRQIVPMRPIVVSVSSSKADAQPSGDGGDTDRMAALLRAIRRVRNALVIRYGVTVPVVEIDRLARLEPDAYEIAIHEVVVASGRFYWDRACLRVTPDIEALAREHGVAQSFPLIDGAAWIERHRLPEPAGRIRLDAIDYFAALLRRLLERHASRFVGIHEAQLVFNWLQREMPATAKELSQALTLPRFAEVMKLLVVERVSLRNVREMAETLVAWAPREKDTTMLAEHVRIALGAQLCQEFSFDGVLYAWLLDRAWEEELTAALQATPLGSVLTVGHETTQALVDRIRARTAAGANTAIVPVVLTTQALRRPLRQLLADELFETPILSYAELSPMQRVQVLATLSRESEPAAAA